MLRALNTAATGMASQEANVNTISNNIANVNTTGYKKSRTEFEDLLYETVEEAGSRTSADTKHNVGVQMGSGSKVSATRRIHQQGSPVITQNPFDLMINGEGFFGIITPKNEVMYTRDGSFNVNSQGQLVNKSGYKLFPGISIPPGTLSVKITEEGNVDAYIQGQVEPTQVGQVPIFTFTNPVGLKANGGNLLRTTASSGEPLQQIGGNANAGVIRQGALEASNVSIMNEMQDLIKAQRAFETNSKVMGIADQMLNTINNITR